MFLNEGRNEKHSNKWCQYVYRKESDVTFNIEKTICRGEISGVYGKKL